MIVRKILDGAVNIYDDSGDEKYHSLIKMLMVVIKKITQIVNLFHR